MNNMLTLRQKEILYLLERVKEVNAKFIYNYIQERAENGYCLAYAEYPAKNNKQSNVESCWNNSTAKRQITTDLQALEKYDGINKIIIRNGNGIKICSTEEEAKYYVDSMRKQALKALKKYQNAKRRLLAHNQTRIILNKEKDYVQAYKG